MEFKQTTEVFELVEHLQNPKNEYYIAILDEMNLLITRLRNRIEITKQEVSGIEAISICRASNELGTAFKRVARYTIDDSTRTI